MVGSAEEFRNRDVMAYGVWIDMVSQETDEVDEVANAQLPDLIMDLIHAGWEVQSFVRFDEDEDADHDGDDEAAAKELLDVRVLNYPSGAFIGIAVDTDVLDEAVAVGISLGRHLGGAAPALLGWTVESLRAEKLKGPDISGLWLPELRDRSPHFPVSEHLAPELLRICSQYLLAAAARGVDDPTRRQANTVDPADLVAGGAIEHPWRRELTSELGTLLIAAGRSEAETGVRAQLTGHGEGDAATAQALLDAVRSEIDAPATDFDDDGMRGHVVLEQFMADHELTWNRVDDTLDNEADEQRSQAQLRVLLWAGLRVLATLARQDMESIRTPWSWLSTLDSDDIDDIVDTFAERDEDALDNSDEEDENELSTAATAHLLVRMALLHPDLLEAEILNATEPELLLDEEMTSGPLHHVVVQALQELGPEPVEQVTAQRSPANHVARVLLPYLHALDIEDGDPFDDLHSALENVLTREAGLPEDHRDQVANLLMLISTAAEAAGPERAADIARSLLMSPSMTACVIESSQRDDAVDESLYTRIIAEAATIDPEMAGRLISDLPMLRSNDPRDEPAFRAQAMYWWTRTLEIVRRESELLTMGTSVPSKCPKPGADIVHHLAPDECDVDQELENLPTETVAVAIVQVISFLSITADDANLPYEIMLSR